MEKLSLAANSLAMSQSRDQRIFDIYMKAPYKLFD